MHMKAVLRNVQKSEEGIKRKGNQEGIKISLFNKTCKYWNNKYAWTVTQNVYPEKCVFSAISTKCKQMAYGLVVFPEDIFTSPQIRMH
jgi:hypothetical protein